RYREGDPRGLASIDSGEQVADPRGVAGPPKRDRTRHCLACIGPEREQQCVVVELGSVVELNAPAELVDGNDAAAPKLRALLESDLIQREAAVPRLGERLSDRERPVAELVRGRGRRDPELAGGEFRVRGERRQA